MVDHALVMGSDGYWKWFVINSLKEEMVVVSNGLVMVSGGWNGQWLVIIIVMVTDND